MHFYIISFHFYFSIDSFTLVKLCINEGFELCKSYAKILQLMISLFFIAAMQSNLETFCTFRLLRWEDMRLEVTPWDNLHRIIINQRAVPRENIFYLSALLYCNNYLTNITFWGTSCAKVTSENVYAIGILSTDVGGYIFTGNDFFTVKYMYTLLPLNLSVHWTNTLRGRRQCYLRMWKKLCRYTSYLIYKYHKLGLACTNLRY